MRLAVRYATGRLKRLGQELVEGSWSDDAVPMSTPEALSVLVEAARNVLDDGAASVLRETRKRLRELAAYWEPGE